MDQVNNIDDFVESGDSRKTSRDIMRAIATVASDDPAQAERIWREPSFEETLAVWEIATNNGKVDSQEFCWGANGSAWAGAIETERLVEANGNENIISAVLGDDAEVIELTFDPVRAESPVMYRYPEVSSEWQSCPFQSADLRQLSNEQACAKVHAWVG